MLHARDIESVGVDPDQVAAVRRCDRVETVAGQRLAQLGDVDVDRLFGRGRGRLAPELVDQALARDELVRMQEQDGQDEDRKSTRLNSSHVSISYAVFCLN